MMSLKPLLLTGVLLVGAAHISLAQSKRVLYQTGFEQPIFSPGYVILPGQASGQGNFIAYDPNSISAATIVSDVSHGGAQSLHIDGSRLPWFDHDYEGYYYPYSEYYPMAQSTPIIEVSWDMMFCPDQGYPGLSGISAYDPAAELYAGMEISADGLLHYGGAVSRTVQIKLSHWHHMKLRLDFSTRTAQFFLNRKRLGHDAFASTIATCFSDADLHIKSGVVPCSHQAYFDNYKITASTLDDSNGNNDGSNDD